MAKSNDDLILPKRPTLADFQKYLIEMEEARGFDKQGVLQKCLMLGEEVGELFKAIRKAEGVMIDKKNSKFGSLAEELADCLIFLFSIANRYDIDLEKAFRDKECVSKLREWS